MRTQYGNGFECQHDSHATIRILALLQTVRLNQQTLWHLQLCDTNKSIKSSSATTKMFSRWFFLLLLCCVRKSNLLYYSRDRFDCNLSVPRIWVQQFVRFCLWFSLLVVSIHVVISVSAHHTPFDSIPFVLCCRSVFASFLYGFSNKLLFNAKSKRNTIKQKTAKRKKIRKTYTAFARLVVLREQSEQTTLLWLSLLDVNTTLNN